jgi:hypothetical protein
MYTGPKLANNPQRPFPSRLLNGGKNLVGTAFQAVGTGGAYIREIPLLGYVSVGLLAFCGENIRQGYNDTRARIEARKAERADSPADMVGAADRGLSQEEKEDLREQARASLLRPQEA